MLLTAILITALLAFLLGFWRGRAGMTAAIRQACTVTRDRTFEEIYAIAVAAHGQRQQDGAA